MVPRVRSDPDEWDENWDDEAEGPETDDEDDTIPCPHCSREIYDDSERCPYCGKYISSEDRPPERKPWWIIVGTVLCLYVIYRGIFG